MNSTLKIIVVIGILILSACSKSQPPIETPTYPAAKVISTHLQHAFDETQELLDDKTKKQKYKICELAMRNLVEVVTSDIWIYENTNPRHPSIEYELAHVKTFYNNCKKTQK